jgi:hypothetical protein
VAAAVHLLSVLTQPEQVEMLVLVATELLVQLLARQ